MRRRQGTPVSESFVYKTAGGLRLEGWAHYTSGGGPRPALLWLHGGALIFGSRNGLRPEQLRRYLAAGYAVVSVDYRLAPQAKLPEIGEDVQDAYRWLLQEGPRRFPIARERIGVVGHSAGGYLALLLGCHARPAPRAVVSFYGYGDITGEWYTTPSAHYCGEPPVSEAQAQHVRDRPLGSADGGGDGWPYYLYLRQRGLWPLEVSGHDPRHEPAWFDYYCPLRQVRPGHPPTLLLHGDQDTDVPYGQAVAMAQALARQGVEQQLLTLPGRGHAFDNDTSPGALAAVFDDVIAFLNGHLMLEAQEQGER